MAKRHNYLEKLKSKKQSKISAGLVSERFPEVSSIIIHMTYYQQGINPVLMQRTINVFSTDYAYFNMACMIKGCEGSGFDLTSVIANMVKTRKKLKTGALSCSGSIDSIASEHASITYKIGIQYYRGLR